MISMAVQVSQKMSATSESTPITASQCRLVTASNMENIYTTSKGLSCASTIPFEKIVDMLRELQFRIHTQKDRRGFIGGSLCLGTCTDE